MLEGEVMGLENAPYKVMASGRTAESGMEAPLKSPLCTAEALVSFD